MAEHQPPLAAHLRAQVEPHLLLIPTEPHRQLLGLRFERHVRLKQLDGAARRFILRDLSHVHVQLGEDGPACIVTLELAHLPLLGQHPQGIAHFGLKGALKVVLARSAFKAIPERHGREQALGQSAMNVRDEILSFHSFSYPICL